MSEEKMFMDKMQIDAELRFIKINRVNFSKQADEVVEKIKKGIKPSSTDYFILLNTNQEQIDERIKYDDITNRMEKGRMTYTDIDFLVGMLGSVGEYEKLLKKTLYKKLDQVNLEYAKQHADEFAKEEVAELEKKCKNSNVQDVLKEEIVEMLSV